MACMDPDTALRLQISRYQRMTGEERLAIGLRLHELACAMALEGIRRQNPDATEEELRDLLQGRLALTRNA
jgi:Rv0078B-related antitoxin